MKQKRRQSKTKRKSNLFKKINNFKNTRDAFASSLNDGTDNTY